MAYTLRFLSAGGALLVHFVALRAAEPVSFESLRVEAVEKAKAPYEATPDTLSDFWKNLNYDEHRQIQYRPHSGLWWEEKRPFSVDFFHPGWMARNLVSIFEMAEGQTNPVPLDPSGFNYGSLKVPEDVKIPAEYAGWRARGHLNTTEVRDEFLVFLGASYFRAIPAGGVYGISGRGLSINSGLPGVTEEFPVFTRFYLEQPAMSDESMTVLAFLEGESVAGAYRFVITPGEETVMEVEAEITLRRPVQQLGLVPFSSMFWFGESTHSRPHDFRPEVHDSDGLLMELADGTRHYRPLEHSRDQHRHCVFSLDQPRSWSVLQRDRAFTSYEDAEAKYHQRPGVTVEPLEGLEKGRLHLIEIPTPDETHDNISILWEPEATPEVGKPYLFKYRLHWTNDPRPSELFSVRATRSGSPVQLPDQLLMTIDFAKPLYPEKKVGNPQWDDISEIEPVVTLSDPSVELIHAGIADLSMPNVESLPLGIGHRPEIHMPQVLRVTIVLKPGAEVKNLDMTCELQGAGGKVLSERWVYLWKKPV